MSNKSGYIKLIGSGGEVVYSYSFKSIAERKFILHMMKEKGSGILAVQIYPITGQRINDDGTNDNSKALNSLNGKPMMTTR